MSEPTPIDLEAPELPYIQILENDSVVLAYASKDGGEESMPLPPQVGQILGGINEFIATQVAEVDRLTRIVNGYDRTPAEQRSAEAEAEVEWLRAENAGLRGGHVPMAATMLTAEADAAQMRERYEAAQAELEHNAHHQFVRPSANATGEEASHE